ncbi:unnamed protein product, partial [marine sediment metagenome]
SSPKRGETIMNKLLNVGIALISIAAVSLIYAIVLEIQTGEPVYLLVMKIAAGLFGVGGPLFGLALARRGKRDSSKRNIK